MPAFGVNTMDDVRLTRTETRSGDAVFTLRVPVRKADLVEAHLASHLGLMGLDRDPGKPAIDEPPGVLLKRLRQQCRMTQKAVADLAGVTQSRISDMESGTRAIPPEAAKRLAEHFGVAISAFLK